MTNSSGELDVSELEYGTVADETKITYTNGDMRIQIHQPHGALQLIRLYDGVELFSRVTDSGRATSEVQLTWDQVRELRDGLNELLEVQEESP